MCKNTLRYFGVNFLKRQLKRNGGSIYVQYIHGIRNKNFIIKEILIIYNIFTYFYLPLYNI